MPICKTCHRERTRMQMYCGTSECRTCHNREYLREYQHEYYQANKEYLREYQREHKRERYASDPTFRFKRLSRATLHSNVRNGKIIRPNQCSKCSSTGNIHAHHEDYSKPLKVIWLCKKCHTRLHNDQVI